MHPLAPDLSELSNEELYKKYNELNSKFMIAHLVGTGSLVQQMNMLLENYRAEMGRRHEKMLADASKNSNFKNIIDIK